MSTKSKSKRIKWLQQILVLAFAGLFVFASCRDPEFEKYDFVQGDYDPEVASEDPAPLCPPGATQPINNGASPYVGGEVAAGLTVEIFTYFRCPNCAQLALLMRDLFEEREDYRDTVKVYFHHFPLYEHETVMELHAAGVAIQDQTNEGFWLAHDWVFARLAEEPPQLSYSDDLRDYAQNELGLDMDRFDEVFNDEATWNYILWDKGQGVDLDVLGTPGIFICGEATEGGWSNIESEIDSYLY